MKVSISLTKQYCKIFYDLSKPSIIGSQICTKVVRGGYRVSEDTKKPPIIEESSIGFDFIKSPYFRNIHLDGVYGGITPKGNIHMAVYNERFAIPKKMVYRVASDGSLGDEIIEKREQLDVVRELEANILLDLNTAKYLIGWLQNQVDAVEGLSKTVSQSGGSN